MSGVEFFVSAMAEWVSVRARESGLVLLSDARQIDGGRYDFVIFETGLGE